MAMKFLVSFLAIILLFVSNCFSEYKFTATVSSNNVQVGEQIQVTFTLNTTSGKNFQPPSFKGFTVLAGPSRSMSTQIINGQISSSMSFIYILSADIPGTFVIEPAKITVDGNLLTTNPITITVRKASESKNEPKQKDSQEKTLGEQASEIISNNIFIKLSVDKSQVYLGEPISATYRLYVHPNLNIVNVSVPKMPSFNGFWTHDFGIKELKFRTEVINGVPFRVADLKQVILIPQQTGVLTIEPMEIDFVVRLLVKQQRQRSRDPFDMLFDDPFFSDPFFSNRYKDFPFTVKSKTASVKVLPLPEPQPSDFYGAVGNIQLKAWLDKSEARVGDIVTLKIQLNGSGNLKLLSPFNISFPNDFDVYEPKRIDNTNVTPSGVSGNVIFEYYLVPKNPGEFKINSIKYSYFDLQSRKYVALQTPEFNLKVTGEPTKTLLTGVRKEEVKVIGQDIRFIKTEKPKFVRANSHFWASWGYFAFSGLPFLLWLFLFVFYRRKQGLESNLALLRQHRAKKIALKHLANAKNLLNKGNKEQFYEETAKALWGFVANRLNISPTELTKDIVSRRLAELGIDDNTIAKLLELINNCEIARFAPIENNFPTEKLYLESVEILSVLSEKLG